MSDLHTCCLAFLNGEQDAAFGIADEMEAMQHPKAEEARKAVGVIHGSRNAIFRAFGCIIIKELAGEVLADSR